MNVSRQKKKIGSLILVNPIGIQQRVNCGVGCIGDVSKRMVGVGDTLETLAVSKIEGTRVRLTTNYRILYISWKGKDYQKKGLALEVSIS